MFSSVFKVRLKRSRKVYALVGRSGTGKSFRAQYVASKNHIKLIIDDGLLIKDDVIIAGKSAKQELNFITAVKRALFQDPDHLQQVLTALSKEKSSKILIIGTSEKMVMKICDRLNLPDPSTIIHIEEIATKEEIDTAMRSRYAEGKHVIPVPPLQITRSYPSIVYDSIRIGLHKSLPFIPLRKNQIKEKTIVKPEFTKIESMALTEISARKMVEQCLYEYENQIKVEYVSVVDNTESYSLTVKLRTPLIFNEKEQEDLKMLITDSLEKYGGILIKDLSLEIFSWN